MQQELLKIQNARNEIRRVLFDLVVNKNIISLEDAKNVISHIDSENDVSQLKALSENLETVRALGKKATLLDFRRMRDPREIERAMKAYQYQKQLKRKRDIDITKILFSKKFKSAEDEN